MRLEGTKVLLSGDFEGMSRDDVVAALKAAGAVIADSVGFDVEIVFAGENPGKEVDSAMELGVRVEDGRALAAALAGDEPPPKAAVEAPMAPPMDEPFAPPMDDGAPTPQRTSAPATAGGERVFGKGEQVRIIGGREGIGEVGEIFWWGDSKFGEGMRAGVTGSDGTKYWVDEADLAWPDDEVDEDALKDAIASNVFGRGDRVKITQGKGANSEGMIFWWGESKWGDGMRAGVETDDGEKLWVDAEHLAAIEGEDEDSDIPF